MSALDEILKSDLDLHVLREARAELAALNATVAEQARQLAEARELIEYAMRITIYPYKKEADEWLAANAAENEQHGTV